MKTINNLISKGNYETLKSIIGHKLISYSHEPFNIKFQPANDFFMRVGFVCGNKCFILDNRVDWEDEWFSSADYIPHMVFYKVEDKSEFTNHDGFSLAEFENYPVNEMILDIILVQDEVSVLKDGKPHESISSTEGTVFVTDKRQYAFYKENTWLDETILEFKGHCVLSKLEDINKHWNIFAKPYDGLIKRQLVYLSSGKIEFVGENKIIGCDCDNA